MKLNSKTAIGGIAAAIIALILLPVLTITLIITPTTVANSPEQQLNECDAQMRASGLVAQNDTGTAVNSPNSGNNAQVVVAVGEKMRIPPQGIVVALATGLQESGLKNYANDGSDPRLQGDQRGVVASMNLPHDAVGHDHGSIGIMQQQFPWWGSVQELMTPAIAARKFYEALQKVSGWQNMPVTVAAQTVQGSAAPDAYAKWEPRARALYAAYRGSGGNTSDSDAAAAGLAPSGPAGASGSAQDPNNHTLCDILKTSVNQQKAQAASPILHASEAGVRAVRAAQSEIGLPYVWGGGGFDGPTGGGFDCSGLTSYAIFQASGIKLPRTTYDQINVGTRISDLHQMAPGDLVLSNFSERGPEHVQLYAGGGMVVEAQTFGVPVKMSPLPHSRIEVRRVLPAAA